MKNIIEKTVLGAALVLAVFVGPALSSSGTANQQAAAIKAAENARGAADYAILDPLNRDQLIDVIKCLTNGSKAVLQKCVAKFVPPPANPTPAVMSMGASDPQVRASNYRISSVNGAQKVTLLNFMVDSYEGAGKIKTLPIGLGGNVIPTSVYLFDGNTLIASKAGARDVVFDNINLVVPINSQKILAIKADYAPDTVSGSRSSVFITPGTYEKVPGVTATMGGGGVDGPMQYFYSAVAKYKLASTPTITIPPNSTSTSLIMAVFPLTVQADGGTVKKPSTSGSDFGVVFSNGTNTYQATSRSAVVIPNQDIADGSTASVTVTAYGTGSTILTSGLYRAYISSIKWDAGSGIVTQTYGLEDFKTPSIQFNK